MTVLSRTAKAVIAGAEPFDDCVTKRSGGPYWSCSDTATVSPLAIPALSTIKYVKADAPHGLAGIPEVLSTADRFVCDGTATPEGFYRSPCVPVTLPGATETWRFTVVNSGTLPMDQIVSIDNLPTPGDQGRIATVPRESAWQPTFVGGAVLVPMPTTPVVPSPRWIGMPHSVSLAATTSAVRTSSKHSSGCAWMSRRTAAMPAAWVRRESISFMHRSLARLVRAWAVQGEDPSAADQGAIFY